MKTNQTAQTNSRRQQARTAFQEGNLTAAKTLYEKLCEKNRNDAESFYMLGAINGQLGMYKEATVNFQRTIDLQPTAVVAHCGLGAAFKAQGNLVKAEECFREALRLQPQFPDAQLELASILFNRGKLPEAETHLLQLLKSRPATAVARRLLGQCLQARGCLTEATGHYRRALEINPNFAECHNNLGYALYYQGDLEGAIEHCRRATEISPQYLEAHRNLGTVLIAAGRLEEAKTAYRNALKIKPGYVDAIAGEAAVLGQQGDYRTAYENLMSIVNQGIEHAGVALTLARLCQHVGHSQDTADYLEKLLKHEGLPITTREQMHFALGKLHDAFGSYNRAFTEYQRGNMLRPANFDAAGHAAFVEELIGTFSEQFLSTAPRASYKSDRPLFIVGMPRSGTSLVEQILASHPDVYGAGELPDVGKLANALPSLLAPDSGYPRCVTRLTPNIGDEVAKTYLDRLAMLSPEASRITDKMPQNFMHLGLISLLFPGARVIHCLRDARDTCLSIYFQNFSTSHAYANNLENIGAYYRQYEKLMRHWKCTLDLPILEVRYEEIVADQEAASRRLIEYAGLAWDPRCLEFHRTDRVVNTASYDQVRQPIYARSIGRWQNYEQHLEPLLRALGG